jgi:CBS domain-containing protein
MRPIRVKDLSLRSLLSIRPEDDLVEAARRMSLHRADCLLVMSGNRRVGIITASDLVRAMAAGLGPREVRVADFMSSDPATVDPEEPARRAAARMRAIGVRHLAVVEDGEPTGLLSAHDLMVLLKPEPD